jgi:hypothetical protein
MSNNQEQVDKTGHTEQDAATLRVECYAGYRAEESPRLFFIGTRKIAVIEIIDRWLDPGHSHFKVKGDDGGIYILRYDQDTDSWKMILYNSGTRDEIRLSQT